MKVALDLSTKTLRFNTLIVGRGGSFKPVEQSVSWPGPDEVGFEAWPADVNGDAKTDYLFSPQVEGAEGVGRVALLAALSRGDGTFRVATSTLQYTGWQDATPGGASGWQAHCQPGDVNGDENADLLCSSVDAQGHFVGVALSRGDGRFELARTPLPGVPKWPGYTLELFVGDVNADGLDDAMLWERSGAESCWWDQPTCWHIRLLAGISTGDGRIVFDDDFNTGWDGYGRFFAADINGDGRSDVVRLKQNWETKKFDLIETAIRRPDWGFDRHAQSMTMPLELADRVLIGDADGDGTDDLLVSHLILNNSARAECGDDRPYTSTLTRVYSNGDGTFALPEAWENCEESKPFGPFWLDGPRAADVNGDGRADFVGGPPTAERSDLDRRRHLAPDRS
jgi:hypothetical protein